MKILAIDTSTNCLSIAVSDEDGLVVEHSSMAAMKHSSLLLPLIADCLGHLGLSIEEIDGFAVSLGPGSFTGLRIGVATMKGLAFSLKKPIVGIPTLDVLAENVGLSTYQVLPILDAKRDEVYACIYGFSRDKLKRLSDYMIVGIEELLRKVGKKTIFLGDGLIRYQDVIRRKKRNLALFAPRDLWYPKASIVAKQGLERLKAGKVNHTYDLVPLYLRRPEAEEKLNLTK